MNIEHNLYKVLSGVPSRACGFHAYGRRLPPSSVPHNDIYKSILFIFNHTYIYTIIYDIIFIYIIYIYIYIFNYDWLCLNRPGAVISSA